MTNMTDTAHMTQPWEIAHSLLGTPFRHQGRSRSGCDCVGTLVCVAKELELPVKDLMAYSREPLDDTLPKYLEANCGPPLSKEEGYAINDILLIQFPKAPAPSHVAIVAPHPQGYGMIHCYATVGKVVYHRIDVRWERRIVGVYKWPAKP